MRPAVLAVVVVLTAALATGRHVGHDFEAQHQATLGHLSGHGPEHAMKHLQYTFLKVLHGAMEGHPQVPSGYASELLARVNEMPPPGMREAKRPKAWDALSVPGSSYTERARILEEEDEQDEVLRILNSGADHELDTNRYYKMQLTTDHETPWALHNVEVKRISEHQSVFVAELTPPQEQTELYTVHYGQEDPIGHPEGEWKHIDTWTGLRLFPEPIRIEVEVSEFTLSVRLSAIQLKEFWWNQEGWIYPIYFSLSNAPNTVIEFERGAPRSFAVESEVVKINMDRFALAYRWDDSNHFLRLTCPNMMRLEPRAGVFIEPEPITIFISRREMRIQPGNKRVRIRGTYPILGTNKQFSLGALTLTREDNSLVATWYGRHVTWVKGATTLFDAIFTSHNDYGDMSVEQFVQPLPSGDLGDHEYEKQNRDDPKFREIDGDGDPLKLQKYLQGLSFMLDLFSMTTETQSLMRDYLNIAKRGHTMGFEFEGFNLQLAQSIIRGNFVYDFPMAVRLPSAARYTLSHEDAVILSMDLSAVKANGQPLDVARAQLNYHKDDAGDAVLIQLDEEQQGGVEINTRWLDDAGDEQASHAAYIFAPLTISLAYLLTPGEATLTLNVPEELHIRQRPRDNSNTQLEMTGALETKVELMVYTSDFNIAGNVDFPTLYGFREGAASLKLEQSFYVGLEATSTFSNPVGRAYFPSGMTLDSENDQTHVHILDGIEWQEYRPWATIVGRNQVLLDMDTVVVQLKYTAKPLQNNNPLEYVFRLGKVKTNVRFDDGVFLFDGTIDHGQMFDVSVGGQYNDHWETADGRETVLRGVTERLVGFQNVLELGLSYQPQTQAIYGSLDLPTNLGLHGDMEFTFYPRPSVTIGVGSTLENPHGTVQFPSYIQQDLLGSVSFVRILLEDGAGQLADRDLTMDILSKNEAILDLNNPIAVQYKCAVYEDETQLTEKLIMISEMRVRLHISSNILSIHVEVPDAVSMVDVVTLLQQHDHEHGNGPLAGNEDGWEMIDPADVWRGVAPNADIRIHLEAGAHKVLLNFALDMTTKMETYTLVSPSSHRDVAIVVDGMTRIDLLQHYIHVVLRRNTRSGFFDLMLDSVSLRTGWIEVCQVKTFSRLWFVGGYLECTNVPVSVRLSIQVDEAIRMQVEKQRDESFAGTAYLGGSRLIVEVSGATTYTIELPEAPFRIYQNRPDPIGECMAGRTFGLDSYRIVKPFLQPFVAWLLRDYVEEFERRGFDLSYLVCRRLDKFVTMLAREYAPPQNDVAAEMVRQ